MTINNYFDVAVLCILALFSVRGLLQGFVSEVAGVAAIVLGFWCAHRLYPGVSVQLTFIGEPAWRGVVAYVGIFLVVLILVGLAARLLRTVLAFSFVSWIDKLAGASLGLVKGLIICSLLLILVQRFLGEPAFMRDSRVLPYLNAVMEQVRTLLPPDFVAKFRL